MFAGRHTGPNLTLNDELAQPIAPPVQAARLSSTKASEVGVLGRGRQTSRRQNLEIFARTAADITRVRALSTPSVAELPKALAADFSPSSCARGTRSDSF